MNQKMLFNGHSTIKSVAERLEPLKLKHDGKRFRAVDGDGLTVEDVEFDTYVDRKAAELERYYE